MQGLHVQPNKTVIKTLVTPGISHVKRQRKQQSAAQSVLEKLHPHQDRD
jgi:hypothetical protein